MEFGPSTLYELIAQEVLPMKKNYAHFIYSVGSVVDLWPRSSICERYSALSQHSDWAIVGEELRSAIGKMDERRQAGPTATSNHARKIAAVRTAGATAA